MTCWRTKGIFEPAGTVLENISLRCRPNFRSCAAKWPTEKNPQKGAKNLVCTSVSRSSSRASKLHFGTSDAVGVHPHHKSSLWCGLIDVRYAPIATKFRIAAKYGGPRADRRGPGCPRDRSCRRADRSGRWAPPSLCSRAFSEASGSYQALSGSSPITPTSPSSKAHQKSGPFAPPALPGINAPTAPSDSRRDHRLMRC